MTGEFPPDAPIERIRRHLVGLRMPRAIETLDHLVQQIERGQLGTLKATEMLLAEELTIRETRRIKAALQMARLSVVKTLSGFRLRLPALARPQPYPGACPARLHRSPRGGPPHRPIRYRQKPLGRGARR